MTREEAKALLSQCRREELRDHAFGDREVTWFDDQGRERGFAYFGGAAADLSIYGEGGPEAGRVVGFAGRDARELAGCGKSVVVERNDLTGPDDYEEGACMPGLTLEGVRAELTEAPQPDEEVLVGPDKFTGALCVVHRKRGSYEQHWKLTPATGNDRKAAEEFCRRVFSDYGGPVGSGEKHTVGVELLADVLKEIGDDE